MAKIDFSTRRIQNTIPRLPLEGSIDLTYRCNNNCLHCWVYAANMDEERRRELSTEEWFDIIDQARAMGTREWSISGGEPMLREDFEELFSYLIKKAAYYTLNTNGTLITPSIAKLLKRDGHIMVSIYGATAEVHDRITRNPGSFDACMRGLSCLKEAGVRFMAQLVPMKDNFHQWHEMKALAQSLCPVWRMGAAYLILSASGNKGKNEEIKTQRLTPAQIINLDPPNISFEERQMKDSACNSMSDQRKYSHCLSHRNSFHIDPTGGLSFCCFIREERLRYSLKKGSFAEGWDTFFPALSGEDQNCLVFDQKCQVCELQNECQRCPALSFLEHRHSTAPSEYLCQLTKEGHKFRQNWKAHHQRYFQIAGITIEVNSELEIADNTFSPAFHPFAIDEPGDDLIQLEHFFSLPEWNEQLLGKLVYEQVPWMIFNKGGAWSYVGYSEDGNSKIIYQLAVFNDNYSHGRLFIDSDRRFKQGNLHSLAMFTTDQVWLAQALLSRQAFFVHSCGLVVDGRGMLFVGHSQAGKSTIAKLFADQAELLCDDRNIVRYWPQQGWRVHGTWSHGELSQVSSAAAPLKAVFFLEKSKENTLIPLADRMEIRKRLIPCLPRPYIDAKWWEGIWPLVSQLAAAVPAYILRFDKSGAIVPLIRALNSEMASKQVHSAEPGCSRD
ncbi:MAG: radical SAM protein [Candidatus Aminicenantes bacterium]|nr:radical SAM protein [Candidatus Aminicenantes bacterium]